MASGGGILPSLLGRPSSPPLPPHPPTLPSSSSSHRSWAKIVSSPSHASPEHSPALQKEQFEKLKATVQDFVPIDPDFHSGIEERMRSCAYAKFLGKALPLAQINQALLDVWRGFGSFSIADMANGYYFIRCKDADMLSSIFFEGPWTVAGMVLQLSPWRPNFQPAFEMLSTAAVWVQLHHLPMELWHADMIDSISSQLGRVLKIDDTTLSGTRARFARVCVELDLSQPLKKGVWVGLSSREALVTIQYERLPVLCFRCGRVGHGSSRCPDSPSSPLHSEAPLAPEDHAPQPVGEHSMMVDEARVEKPAPPSFPPPLPVLAAHLDSSSDSFGPWMMVQRRRGRGGRGAGRIPNGKIPSPASSSPTATWHSDPLHVGHVASVQASLSAGDRDVRGLASIRGGSSGRGGRGGFSRYLESELRSDRCLASLNAYPEDPQSILPLIPLPPSSSPGNSIQGASPKAPGSVSGKLPCLGTLPSPQTSHSHSSLTRSSKAPSESSLDPDAPPPILLTSLSSSSPPQKSILPPMSPVSAPPDSESHLALVAKVVSALCPSQDPPPGKSNLEDVLMDAELLSESSEDLEMDMSIDCFLKDSKLKALARKDPNTPGSSRKKGRKSSPP